MTKEDINRINSQYLNDCENTGEMEEIFALAIQALEQEPTTKNDLSSELEKNSKKLEKDFGELDCISRADAIKAMQDKAKELTNEDTINGLCGAVAILFDMPSVTPQEPKMGHWIDKQRLFESCSAECSSCHKRSNGYLHDNGFSLVSKYFDFCPKCGSDNREVEDGNDSR